MKAFAIALLFCALVFGQQPRPEPQVDFRDFRVDSTFMGGFSAFEISYEGKLVLKINGITGQVTFGEGITPSEATRRFVEELKRAWPSICDGRRRMWSDLGVIF